MEHEDRVGEAAPDYLVSRTQGPLSAEEYLELEEASPDRHEYVGGFMYAMSGASVRHQLIATNLTTAFYEHLRGKPCRTFQHGTKLRAQVRQDDIFYYPDVMIACGEIRPDDIYLSEPRLIAEVLSPSTARIDRREKLFVYSEIPSVEEYLLVAQDKMEVLVHRPRENARPAAFTKRSEVIELRSIGLGLPVERIYEGVE